MASEQGHARSSSSFASDARAPSPREARARSEPKLNGRAPSPRGARGGPGAESEEVFALGAWLARQRKLRGIRLEELAALTRLPVRSLERLEAGAFDGQQDGFVRGFVRTVAVAIGLDPDDAVSRMLAEPDALGGSRLPDLRKVVVAAVGLAGALALALALWEFARTPAASEGSGPAPALVRRDAVRALAVERGVLSEEPTAAGPPAVLLPDPLPPPAAENAASDLDLDLGHEAPLGASSLPAAQAPPDRR